MIPMGCYRCPFSVTVPNQDKNTTAQLLYNSRVQFDIKCSATLYKKLHLHAIHGNM